MSTLKSIQINPDLFRLGNKTRKTTNRPMPKPLINPNVLKNKLLTRIKEHKNAEHNRTEISVKNNFRKSRGGNRNNINSNSINVNTNELKDSMEYFSELDKIDNQKYAIHNQNKMRNELYNKTVKNYNHVTNNPFVNLNLPQELMKPHEPPVSSFPIKLNYNIDKEVPHGCLKNGIKPTYKNLYTRRASDQTHTLSFSNQSNQSNQPNEMTREQKLLEMQQKVQQKLKQLQQPSVQSHPYQNQPSPSPIMNIAQNKPPEPSEPIAQLDSLINPKSNAPLPESLLDIFPDLDNGERKIAKQNEILAKARINKLLDEKIGDNISDINDNDKDKDKINTDLNDGGVASLIENDISILLPGKKRQQVKRTIRRKYTVGRNLKTNTIGILIKDNNTRRKIINAQKEMKKKPMNELKKDLKDHNLIKVGSSAPNDVLRATYEYAKLAGNIVNTNTEMLMHNFVNSSDN